MIRMDDKQKVVLLTLGIMAAIGLVVAAYFIFFSSGPKSIPEQKPAESVKAEPASADKEQIPAFPPTSLDNSDDLIRKLAKELSTNSRLDAWLQSKDFVRKFTAAIDNIAAGESPFRQIDFFSPQGEFKVYRIGPAEFIDPASYDRYNLPAEIFVSFDPQEAVRVYQGLKPLFDEAYKELGYPDKDFDQTLKKAVLELLETPVVEGNIRLEKKIKSYAYADARLEELSDAQKALLRLGPANVEAVQIKLRQMAAALGLPADQVPRPRIYSVR
jgi:hypothetical protein